MLIAILSSVHLAHAVPASPPSCTNPRTLAYLSRLPNPLRDTAGLFACTLTAPDGHTLNLVNEEGSSGANFTNTVVSSSGVTALSGASAPFTATYKADASLAPGATGYAPDVTTWASLYTTPNGTWTFSARDNASGDVGTIVNWTITITYTVPASFTWTTNTTNLYTDAGATSAYTSGAANPVYAQPTSNQTYTAVSTISGCSSSGTSVLTVTSAPTITPVTTTTVCGTGTITLTGSGTPNATSAWSSATTAHATIAGTNTISGTVTGVAAGTSVITYKDNNSCTATVTVTDDVPGITPVTSATVCGAGTITLTGSGTPATSGTWASASTAYATISGTNTISGTVTGVAVGTSVITYKDNNNCTATTTVTDDVPSILGTATVCGTGTTTLTGSGTPATSGTWASASTAYATIAGTNTISGTVTGVAAGSSVITYKDVNSCTVTATVTDDVPSILGTLVACGTGTTTLT